MTTEPNTSMTDQQKRFLPTENMPQVSDRTPRCGCFVYCGDLPERDDDPHAVCRALPMYPAEPLVTIEVRHRGAPS